MIYIIALLVFTLIIAIVTKYTITKIIYKKEIYFKKHYIDYCKELGIDKQYIKVLESSKKCLFDYRAEDEYKMKDDIIYHYRLLIIHDLRLNDCHFIDDKYNFIDYVQTHYKEIDMLKTLLDNRFYMYNTFLFQNTICLINSLNEPFIQLDNIDNLNISKEQKQLEKREIKIKIYDAFDTFFKLMYKLKEFDESKNIDKRAVISNFGIFNDLEKYKKLLTNMQDDIEKQRGIF